jgi:hypothetical protein
MGDKASKQKSVRKLPTPTAAVFGAAASADTPQRWECEVKIGSKWTPYQQEQQLALEAAFAGGKASSARIAVGKWEYDVHFDGGE